MKALVVLCFMHLFTHPFAHPLTDILNKERLTYGLPQVTYDYQLEKELKNISIFTFFETNNDYKNDPKLYFNLTCDNKTSTRNRKLKLYNIKNNSQYIFHDTYKTTIGSIFNFRVRQRFCFDLKKCDATKFNNFISCLNKCPDLSNRTDSCKWAFYYYPKIITRSLKSIACVGIPLQGLAVPDHLKEIQNNTFVCYGSIGEQLSDQL